MSMDVSTPYELDGRVDQKRRTRDALVAAARALVADGLTPTVEAVAETASISRTTAYRYFPNQRALLVAAHPEVAATTMLPEDAPPDDVPARLEIVVREFLRMLSETEAQQRTMLRLSLEATAAERAQLPLRQGRAIKWITEALDPLRPKLSEAQVHRLALGIRSVIGIESMAWLIDVGGLSREDAVEVMRGSAHALLQAAMTS